MLRLSGSSHWRFHLNSLRSWALIEKTLLKWNCCVRNFVSFINKMSLFQSHINLLYVRVSQSDLSKRTGFFLCENHHNFSENFPSHRPKLNHKIKATSKHSWLIAFLQDIKNERNIKNAALPFNTEPCHKRHQHTEHCTSVESKTVSLFSSITS